MIIDCRNCGALVDGEVRGQFRSVDRNDNDCKYSLIKCPNCSNPMLVVELEMHDGDGWFPPSRIYPPEETAGLYVPVEISAAYEEAWLCYRAKAYNATAIMCRKALEGITKAHKISRRNLDEGIKAMRDQGIIENRLYEWADALRVSGNEAAHDDLPRTSAEEARDILDFTHALLEYIFTFRDKFEEWKARRKAKSQNAITKAMDDDPFSGSQSASVGDIGE